MVGTSTTEIVLFIGLVSVAVAAGSTLVETSDVVGGAIERVGDQRAADYANDVVIVSDPQSQALYDDGTLTLLVKNTGETRLPNGTDEVTLLVDGERAPVTGSVVVDDTAWRPGAVVRVRTDRDLASGTHRAMVEVRDVRDYLVFEVPP